MNKLYGLLILIFCTSFADHGGQSPHLSKLKISYDHDACSAPMAIFDLNHNKKTLTFSFGYDQYLEKQDTIWFAFRDDSLFINIIKRNKPRIIDRNGVPDTVPGIRSDPDCECNSLINLEFSNVKKKPKGFVIDKYVHDDHFGFVEIYRINQLRQKENSSERTEKFKLDSLFEVKPSYKNYPDIPDLPHYLGKRGTVALVAVDVDSHSEKKLVQLIQKVLVKKNLICETRTQSVFQENFLDQDSTSVWVKLIDTKNFKFPEYRQKKK